jgi:hypothetical protein
LTLKYGPEGLIGVDHVVKLYIFHSRKKELLVQKLCCYVTKTTGWPIGLGQNNKKQKEEGLRTEK